MSRKNVDPKNGMPCDSILDNYLNYFHFSEYHEIVIDQACDKVYPVLKEIDFTDSRIIRFLFWIRGLSVKSGTLDDFIKMGFILLQEKEGEEIVLGFLGGAEGFTKVSAQEFVNVGEGNWKKAFIKGAWNFSTLQISEKITRLTTETRVLCTGKRAKIIFSIYWFFISPFSRWIRRIMLRMIKRNVEKGESDENSV
jgi:hypothetical protein